MLYICIHDDKKIEFAEEWPTDTLEEKEWAKKNAERLDLECRSRGDAAGFVPYASEDGPFAFEEVKP